MSEKFTVEVDIRAKDSTGKALSGAKRGFKDAFQDIASGALRRAGEGLTDFAKQIPGMVVDLGKLGVEVGTAQRRFTQFAGGTDRAAMFMDAFNRGTDNTVDKMSALSSAGRLMQMGLVETGDEMEQVSSIATKLGDQTQGAGDRIADFSALLANQSIPRLDNFGISSGKVRQRIAELLETGKALNREQAFKMAVMEEGAIALDRLGDTSDLASVQMDKLKASLQTARQELGMLIAEDAGAALAAMASGGESADEAIRKLPQRFRDWRKEIQGTTFATRANNDEIRDARNAHAEQRESMQNSRAATRAMTEDLATGAITQQQYQQAMEGANAGLDQLAISSSNYNQELRWQEALTEAAGTATQRSSESFDQYQAAIDGAARATDNASFAMMKNEEQQLALRQMTLGLSMSFTGQLEQMEAAAEGFATKREDIEAEHQENLAQLQKRGQATSVRLNETAELDKLANLQFSMEQAQRRFEEMSGKEKESARLAKENTLAQATEKFQKQQQLLDDFHAGRLVKAGENVGALIAVEDQRHQAALAGLDEEMQKQQEIQEKALGNMVLQSFDSWSEQKDIPVAKMLEMRTGIAEEFGLVSEGATELVTDMVGEWDRWATNTNIATEDVVDLMGQVITETGKVDSALLALTTEEYVIKVRYELSGRPPTAPDGTTTGGTGGTGGPGGGIPMANGGQFMVGERGPEIVTVSPMSGPTYNDTFNVYDTGAMSAVQDQRRRERRQELARTM